jgi:hypothetical protein
MPQRLDQLLQDTTLVTVALAVALGWSLFQVGEGLAVLVTTLFTNWPAESDSFFASQLAPFSWEVGGRILTFGELVEGLVALATALLVALAVQSRRATS